MKMHEFSSAQMGMERWISVVMMFDTRKGESLSNSDHFCYYMGKIELRYRLVLEDDMILQHDE